MSKVDELRALPFPIRFHNVTHVLGVPARDIGSGIHIYEYRLDDGRTLRVGTPDLVRVMYIQLVDGRGSASDIYRE